MYRPGDSYVWIIGGCYNERNKGYFCKVVVKLNIITKKWIIEHDTINDHINPGCLISSDNQYLYVFSEIIIERLSLNDLNPYW